MANAIGRLLIATLVATTLVLVPASRGALAVGPLPAYYLPWDEAIPHYVSQGNNQGTHTGNDTYAWDFTGDGWIVRAAANGTVSLLKDDSSTGGCGPSFASYANYVKVAMDNGHEAQYLHLAYGSVSSRVNLGETVEQYTPIGRTDSTGWVCPYPGGAHLHYQVQNQCGNFDCQSVQSSFLDPNVLAQDSNGIPITGQTVTSGNYFWGPRAAAVSWGAPRLDVFMRGSDNGVWHRYTPDDVSWPGGWENLGSVGGGFSGEPAATSWGSGRLDVFAIGYDRTLWHKWWDGTGWYPSQLGWQSIGCSGVTGTPSAAAYTSNQLMVVARGTDGRTLSCQWNGSAWVPSWYLGGYAETDPVIVSPATNILKVVILGSDNAAWYAEWASGQWIGGYQNWGSQGGGFISQPTISYLSGTQIDVFAVSSNGFLWDNRYNGTAWSTFQALTGTGGPTSVIGSPSGTEWPGGGLLSAIVRDTSGALWDCWPIPATSLTCSWQAHGGFLTSDPLVTSAQSFDEDVLARAGSSWNYSVAHQLYNGGWSPSIGSYDNFGGIME